MELAIVTLVGARDPEGLQQLVAAAAVCGFSIGSVVPVNSTTGQVIDPRQRRLEYVIGDLPVHQVHGLGFGTVDDIAHLTMHETWGRLNVLPGPNFSRIAAYMAANSILFADMSAWAAADGWQRYRADRRSIIPELPDLPVRLRTALGIADVLCYELLAQLTDQELASIHNIGNNGRDLIHTAAAAYELARERRQ